MKMKKLINKQKTDQRATPYKFFKYLNSIFNFTLDPCATKKTAKCDNFFTKDDDGLKKDWSGENVFCNPPYSDVEKWIKKCHEEGQNTLVVALVFSRTSTKWWHQYVMNADKLFFIKRRIKFDGLDHNAPAPSTVVLWDPKKEIEAHYYHPDIIESESMGQP